MLSGSSRRPRGRFVRDLSLGGLGLVSVGLAVWMTLDRPGAGNVATIASLFFGIASLLLALVDFFRQEPARPDPAAYADDLARTLRAQWLEEAEARRLRDPRVLPLAWATTSRPVADDPGRSASGARVLRVRMDGRLDGRFDEAVAQLAAGHAQLPDGRLVIIGEPGAGKTVLAMLLTLGLLSTREAGGPVPVLLPASSWDPARESLDDWIVRTLALPYYSGREEIPRTLLTHGLLLPVLDGLDEIPESARRSAIRGINHAIGGERPVVVTCRANEYEDLIRGGAPTLRRAPVVEMSRVAAEDVVAYLGDVDWPAGTDWDQVLAHLRARTESPLALALSTPLMVTSARLVYQRGGGAPGELLDEEDFDCRYAVEDHLMQQLVDAAYAPDPARPDDAPERGRDRWSPAQARKWLTFLACYLHDHRERDLAWWQMSERLLSRWTGPVVGLGVGGAVALAGILVVVIWGSGTHTGRSLALGALAFGAGCAVLCMIVWYATAGRPPGRLSFSLSGSLGRLGRGFGTGAALAALSIVPVLYCAAVVYSLSLRGFAVVELYCEMLLAAVCLAVVMGLALAVHNWLNAPPARAAQTGPDTALAQDRRSATTGALLAGLVVGLTGLPGWYAGMLSGALLARLFTGGIGWPGRGRVLPLAERELITLRQLFGVDLLVLSGLAVLSGTIFAVLVLLTRAWPRFLLVRAVFALRGQLPWSLMAFLADARRRELLRQVGGSYQFRHIRLQEALAGVPAYADRSPAPRPTDVRRRTVLAVAAVTAIGAVTAGTRFVSRDMSLRVFDGPGVAMAGVAFQPESRSLVCTAANAMSWQWDPSGDRHSLKGLTVPTPVTFHPDGRLLTMDPSHVSGDLWLSDMRHLPNGTPDFPESTYSSLALDVHSGLVLRAFAPESDFGSDSYSRGAIAVVNVWRIQPDGSFTRPMSDGPEQDLCPPASVALIDEGVVAILTMGKEVWRYELPGFTHGTCLLPVGNQPDGLDGTARAIAVSRHDGSVALAGSAGSALWRRHGDDRAWSPTPLPAASALAFSPNAPRLATGDDSGRVRVWRTDVPGAPYELVGHTDAITAMDFSYDGAVLATASSDGTVRLWDVPRFGS
ncbi:NACHT and WD40 repeat domain-containing protein [Streptomyces sp. NPDC101776]|uniref:NACHT and WD40 repeat domain-containing protein n=1 Tax=Streptomyces sp. NPDC101776 TaxID=3366146 RepID=UPI003825CD81